MAAETAATDWDGQARLRARIDALAAAYARTIDDDRLEEWPALFTETAIYRVTTRENREQGLPLSLVYCEGRGMMADRITAMRTANIFEPHVYCHTTGPAKIVSASDAEVRAESNFTVIRTMSDGTMSVFACGKYIDRLEHEGAELRIAERIVVLDSRRIDTLLVIPL